MNLLAEIVGCTAFGEFTWQIVIKVLKRRQQGGELMPGEQLEADYVDSLLRLLAFYRAEKTLKEIAGLEQQLAEKRAQLAAKTGDTPIVP